MAPRSVRHSNLLCDAGITNGRPAGSLVNSAAVTMRMNAPATLQLNVSQGTCSLSGTLIWQYERWPNLRRKKGDR